MKKIFAIIAVAMATLTVSAQSYKDLVKAQQERNKYNKEMANIKPTSADKKQAKQRKKDGWDVMTGKDPMEVQICKARMLQAELMADEDMEPTKRYIVGTSIANYSSYAGAESMARETAMASIASLLETKIVKAAQMSEDGTIQDAISSVGSTTFNERMKTLVQNCLKNMQTPMTVYRVLPNRQYQVEVMVAYDKKQLKRELMQKLQQEMKVEGDKALNPLVDEALEQIK